MQLYSLRIFFFFRISNIKLQKKIKTKIFKELFLVDLFIYFFSVFFIFILPL